MMRNGDHHIDAITAAEILENMKDFCSEHGDLNCEELLLHQESLYQSIKGNERNIGRRSNPVQNIQHNDSSRQGSIDSQLVLDEALARTLQEMEDGIDDLSLSQTPSTSTGHRDVSARAAPSMAVNQGIPEDDIDPDNMTYEQLQFLGEAVGAQSRGLPEHLISRLPKFKYSTGIFKKQKKEDCVICFTTYKRGDKLIALPCAHQYHSDCISLWLRQKKNCPMCLKEVSEQ
ncbi:E3 ubiquitin-protein ligase BIG BROTHER-like [Impatiens glandulifera]|uniref:E3 ubiquitin-protein ligase BIG BROTHER-like n=1 Tax=Impatiens glandulifera TaxID=253017 RepID=UPI001FB069A3|nr:E3 ubiquitin-protein ligase BIG BROTHER-like [Impatiens glandulifera]